MKRRDDSKLSSAMGLEYELGVKHGTIAALVKQGRIQPIYLPTHKRPKYDREAVYRALGVTHGNH